MKRIVLFVFIALISFGGNAQDENPCGLQSSKKALKSLKKATNDLRLGHYLEASNRLVEVLDEEDEFIEGWWMLGDINSRFTNRMRKTSVAIEAYEHVVNLCPAYEDYYAYFYLGKLYYKSLNYKKAHNYFELFLNADTKNIRERHYNEAVELNDWAKFYDQIYGNEVPFDPIKVEDVSTADRDEYLAIITLDNEYMYFTRRQEKKRVSAYSSDANMVEVFSMAKRTGPIKYSVGGPLPYPFNEQPNEGGPTLSIDNKTLYYTRCKYLPNRYFNCDICKSEFKDGSWTEIVPLGTEINHADSWESMPSLSSDGKSLYFVSDRKGGQGGLDIYVSYTDGKGGWQPAKNLGPTVNSPGNEKSPFIHTDSQTLYYSSSSIENPETGEIAPGKRGLGGYDVFFTRLNEKHEWMEPKNLGYPINTENNELGFFVSLDGNYGFFSSNRLNNKQSWDVYSFKLYKEARPQKVLFVKGVLKDEDNEKPLRDAEIVIKNMKTKEVKSIPVNAETGEYVFATTFKNDYVMTVKKRDYVYVSKYISKKNTNLAKPLNISMPLQKIRVGKTYNLEDIYFATDSDKLTKESIDIVESFYEFLLDNKNINIEIQGHTDNVGAVDYNLDLSSRRAKTVYKYLVNRGISADRMTYKGYGESKPVASNETEKGRQQNRRTVFLITGK